jgi:hypothetical protein
LKLPQSGMRNPLLSRRAPRRVAVAFPLLLLKSTIAALSLLTASVLVSTSSLVPCLFNNRLTLKLASGALFWVHGPKHSGPVITSDLMVMGHPLAANPFYVSSRLDSSVCLPRLCFVYAYLSRRCRSEDGRRVACIAGTYTLSLSTGDICNFVSLRFL